MTPIIVSLVVTVEVVVVVTPRTRNTPLVFLEFLLRFSKNYLGRGQLLGLAPRRIFWSPLILCFPFFRPSKSFKPETSSLLIFRASSSCFPKKKKKIRKQSLSHDKLSHFFFLPFTFSLLTPLLSLTLASLSLSLSLSL